MILAMLVAVTLAGFLSLAWRWRPTAKVNPAARVLARILLGLYALLGAWALWFGLFAPSAPEPAGFQFWKPTLMYWILALVLVIAPRVGCDYPSKLILGTYFSFSGREWRQVNRGMATVFGALGALNIYIAYTSTEDAWVGFKYACMLNILFVFLFRLAFVWTDMAGRIVSRLVDQIKSRQP